MGIRGLHKYICDEIPKSFQQINILDEIDNYKRKRGKSPTIIINLWTMFNHFEKSSNIKDDLFGMRLNHVKDKFEIFIDRLVKQGAKVIFVFKKARLRETDFYVNEENDYKRSKKMVQHFKTLNTNEVVEQCRSKFAHKFSRIEILSIALVQSAQKFGKVCGVMHSSTNHSLFIAELARNEDAMAVMGTDSYYLFHEGKWEIWSDQTLNMAKMTIMQYNKKTILSHLGLKNNEMHLFIALAGGLYSSAENIQEIGNYFAKRNINRNIDRFKLIVDFVHSYECPPSNITLQNIVMKIFLRKVPELIEDFRTTFESFKSIQSFDYGEKTKIMEVLKDDYLSFGQDILSDSKLYISSVHLDLNDDKGLLKKLVMSWIEKTAQALLKNEDSKKICLLIKDNDKAKITEHEINVGVCKFPIPDLETLVLGLMNDSFKMKLLDWITGTTVSSKIPINYLTTTIILLHLIKHKAISFFEASCILQSIVEVANKSETLKNDDYPVKIDAKAYRANVLYQKLYLVLNSCLSCVGLKKFMIDVNFDSVRYQIIYSNMRRIDHLNLENEAEMIIEFLSIINND